jgi:hypothetical protein
MIRLRNFLKVAPLVDRDRLTQRQLGVAFGVLVGLRAEGGNLE